MEKEDLRVKKTKRSIEESFMTLFYHYNFEQITVKGITEEAEIGRKTFYLHYLDKYDLVDSIVKKAFTELEVICERKKGLGLKKGSEIWFDYFNEHRLFFERLFKIPNSNSYKKQLKELVINQLKENIDQKLIEDQQLDFQLFLRFFASGIIEFIEIYISDNTYTKEDFVKQIIPLLEGMYK